MNAPIFHCLLTAAVLAPLTPAALGADDGTWTQTASGGLWSAIANWSDGIGPVADGSGFTADFSTIDITADNTVQLDGPRTLTALTFGDTTVATAAGWTLANNGNAANILTLAGTDPSITVSLLGTGKVVTISAAIAGTTGWSKFGRGQLTLSGANTYDAPTTIDSDVGAGGAVALSVNSINSIGEASSSALGQPSTAANGQINLGRSGTLIYTGDTASNDRNFNLIGAGGSAVINNSGTVASLLTLSGDITATGTPVALVFRGARNITASGELNLGTGGLTKTDAGIVTVSGNNTFTGPIFVASGRLFITGVNTSDSPTSIATPTSGGSSPFSLTVNSINSIGAESPSALGQPTSAENGQINIGRLGNLTYTGGTASSDRNFFCNVSVTNGSGGNAAIQNNGAGLLTLTGEISSGGTANTTPADFILRGTQDITASGQLSLGVSNFLKVDAGTVTLSNPLNVFSGYVHIHGGTLSVNSISSGGDPSALGTGTQIRLSGGVSPTATATLVYTGTGDTSDRTLTLAGTTGGATLDQSGTGLLKFTSNSTVTANGAKTLTLQGSTAGTGEIAGTIVDSGSGATSVAKSGTGTWALTGSNTYTGGTTVSDGTLKLGNGTLNTSLADTSTVIIAAGAKLHLDFPTGAGDSDTVQELYLGTPAVQVPAGTYDASTPIYGAYFLGTGSLTVTTGPTITPFQAWVTGSPYNLSGPDALFDANPDNDGLKNGLEWILGGDPTTGSPNKAPVPTRNLAGDLVLNFTREETSIGQATLKVLIGTDLASWPFEATVEATSSGPDVNGVSITIDTAATPDAVTVTIPAALAAPGGKIFSRLQATQP